MRILIVSRPFVFHGGVERATAGFLGALVAHGHDVHLLSPPGQRLQEAGRGLLHPAVEGEWSRDHEELHRTPVARSTSGKSAARAAVKL